MARGIYLVGFSGSGKSTIAKLIGESLQWPACDLDELIVERSGMTIPLIFQQEGEPGFRLREADALRAASSSGPFVIATGGGTVVRAENRSFMASKGWIICLEAHPQTLLGRIQQQLKESDPKAIRPMLDAVYPLDQIRALKHTRQTAYGLADWTVHTDRLTTEQVAAEVIRAADMLERSGEPPVFEDVAGAPMRHSLNPDLPPPIMVAAGPWPYHVVIDWNHLPSLGEQVRRVLPQARRAAILTDTHTWERLGSTVKASLQAAGLEVHVRDVSPNEAIKTPEEASAIHNWLLGIPLRRDDVFVIIGGGAIDDLGGFAASTYMRGVALVKVPTSLEGMVDSSIGGKTALNHPRARNLIGTFFHPRLVWSDASLLRDEPEGELRASWAEVIKYAMLESSLLRDQVVGITLFDELNQNVSELLGLEKRILLNIIARCVALKAQVVAGDERDSGQYRIFLNYGHTLGYALETATNYELRHGEAVAIGMAFEASLSVRLGLADAEVEARQNNLLTRFGLPTRLPQVSHDLLLSRINYDKKVFGSAPRWILPVAIGRAVVSSRVSEADLIAVLEAHSS
jgi:shikimate kinase / 3-dehydroquinate synthase